MTAAARRLRLVPPYAEVREASEIIGEPRLVNGDGLLNVGDGRLIPALIPDWELLVRLVAARVVARLDRAGAITEVLDCLARALRDPDQGVQQAAVEATSRLPDSTSVIDDCVIGEESVDRRQYSANHLGQ